MNEGTKCDCCKTRKATWIVTGATDATPAGTRYCDTCVTATSADVISFDRLNREPRLTERATHLLEQAEDAGNAGLRTITKLRAELDRMEAAIRAGIDGEPIYANDLTPSHQTLQEIVAYGVEFKTLWNAHGLLSRA